MATERLDMAVKNFQHMNQLAERYTRLCRSYVQLAERFHQLDVDHMTLKGQTVSLLNVLKTKQDQVQQVNAHNAQLQHQLNQLADQHRQEMQALTRTYEEKIQDLTQHLDELKPLESLMTSERYQDLVIAEEQMELVEATFLEIDQNGTPDLSREEQTLLAAYRADPSTFLAGSAQRPTVAVAMASLPEAESAVS
ncbi:hypothetical protein [Nodosilinea sp. P-1105]|uniref:hypothetical protein n=1 Tax=Nodosilinea sp. P-1105 TaxID=2546229 RepID=UPI00146F0CF0|nr:hypothetical protein [Nodosilinea sp. P-1105]NMF84872.1 hypothetical protein [Nodosilinea sp. P-1105]